MKRFPPHTKLSLGLVLIASVAFGQQVKPNAGAPTTGSFDTVLVVLLIVETDGGTALDRTDAGLSVARGKIYSALKHADLKVVENVASEYSAVVRVHYRDCSVVVRCVTLTIARNGNELARTGGVFSGGDSSRYAYTFPFIGEFTRAVLTNDPTPLLRLLKDSSITARTSAPEMLSNLPQASVVSALTDALTAHDQVRDNAMGALSKIASKSTDPALWRPFFMAASDDQWIRAVLVSEHPSQFTNGVLSKLSASENPATQSAANEISLKIRTLTK
jgi:hypothetical protein